MKRVILAKPMDVRNSSKEPAGYLKICDEENPMYGDAITVLPV